MRGRPAFALRPLSLAITTLFRGSAALHNPARFAPETQHQRCLFGAPSSLPATVRAGLHDSAVVGQGSGRARRWVIPWGNDAGKGKGKGKGNGEDTKLTRTLKVLPDAAADLEESDYFRVMSFNMLAQPMASSKMFPYVPKNQLKKGNRGPRVRAEVCRYGADVICLQECDSFHEILTSLQEDKANRGLLFEGVYKRRNNSENSHGVAILYDSERFRLLDSGSCDYGRYLFGGVGSFALLQDRRRLPPRSDSDETVGRGGDLRGPIGTGPDAGNGFDRLGRQGGENDATAEGEEEKEEEEEEEEDGVARRERWRERWLGEALRPGAEASESGIVCVATSHLYWHPDGGAIRLAQAETLMARVATFLEERFGDSYGSVPLVLAGDLNNVPGIDVYRLLSNGACEGGTPEAFHRRKRERARAKKEQELQKARQAVALVAEIRARNAALISAARSSSSVDGEDNSNSAATTNQGALHSPSPAVVEPAEASGVGGAAPAAAAPAAPAATGRAGDGMVDAAESSASSVDSDASRGTPEIPVNKPDGDRDEDVRRYEQGFRGLRSAYGAYSSVFNSQLSKKRPAGESSVCEVTGQHTIGHVRLGARQRGGNGSGGGGSAREPSGDVPELSLLQQQEEEEEEEEEADGSMGEPQLTTCTDNFAGTIDYIWHTPQLQVRSLLDLPSLKQAMQGGGLPTASYPSDHVSIMAELHWRRPAGDGADAPTRQ